MVGFRGLVFPELWGLEVIGIGEGKRLDKGFPRLIISEGRIEWLLQCLRLRDAVGGIRDGTIEDDAVRNVKIVVTTVELNLVVCIDEV